MYPDEFWVDIDYSPKCEDENFFKQYDLVQYHRSVGPDFARSQKAVEICKKLGIPTVCDIDDYWLPTVDHPAFAIVKENKLDHMITESLKIASHITTTTKVFAEEIKKLNKNVTVLPNTVNPRERQFQPKKTDSDLIRIGWLGGSSHLKDLEILKWCTTKIKWNT